MRLDTGDATRRPAFLTRLAAVCRFALGVIVTIGGAALQAQGNSSTQAPVTAPASAGRGLVVPAGAQVDGFVVLRGPVDVYGTVSGDAISVAGDLVVHPGAKVSGDAVSVLGHVRVLGDARVTGDVHSMSDAAVSRPSVAVAPAGERPDTTWHALKLVLGWLTVLFVIGFGVLVTASPYLDGVAESFEGGFARALGIGIAGQMLVLPALLAVVVALALTIVGVLAIPLAIVAFVLATAGLLTLGFLAVAFMTGRSIGGGDRGPGRRRATSARGEALRSLLIGLCLFMSPWLAAAALTSVPFASVVLRTIALATTWVAVTAGFGAALASRAGTRGEAQRAARARTGGRAPERDPYVSSTPGWQTPTPVSGVVAARRPTAVPSTHD
jgi:hypothetical protein